MAWALVPGSSIIHPDWWAWPALVQEPQRRPELSKPNQQCGSLSTHLHVKAAPPPQYKVSPTERAEWRCPPGTRVLTSSRPVPLGGPALTDLPGITDLHLSIQDPRRGDGKRGVSVCLLLRARGHEKPVVLPALFPLLANPHEGTLPGSLQD